MTTFAILGLSILSAILYRLGGIGGAWWKNTKIRDMGCPACVIATAYFSGITVEWWVHFLTFGLTFGALTKYWAKPGPDAKWYTWFATGVVYGLATILYAWNADLWPGFLYRIFFLSGFTAIWSEGISNATLEELGRGFLLCITVPLLTIGG